MPSEDLASEDLPPEDPPPDTAYHDALGDFFADFADTHPTNAYIDRPAMLELIGDAAGLEALDVGCGSGFYTSALLERGATVTGVDGSATMLGHARRATAGRATLHLHNLEQPLTFAGDDSFDLAVMALVYHHVHDRRRLLAELRRVLRPGGRLLISTTHPSAEQRWLGGSYYAGGRVAAPVDGGRFHIDFERLTLEAFIGELLRSGFVLEQLLEPRPIPALRDVEPERFDHRNDNPNVLTVALRNP